MPRVFCLPASLSSVCGPAQLTTTPRPTDTHAPPICVGACCVLRPGREGGFAVTWAVAFTVRLCTCVCVCVCGAQNLLRHLNHDNLVRFYAACDKPPPDGQLCIVMELMKGSLASLLYGEGGGGRPTRPTDTHMPRPTDKDARTLH
eukprot:COSAG01_NODE_9027_length_2578_cov_2.103267_2_plen_146_part_00